VLSAQDAAVRGQNLVGLMFYQSPVPPPPGGGGPPLNPEVSKAIAALTEVTHALKEATMGNHFLYLTETKKLLLAVMGADELMRTLRRKGQTGDQPALFRQELRHQVEAFALMSQLDAESIKQAAIDAENAYPTAVEANPPSSRAGVLVDMLRRRVPSDSQPAEATLRQQPLQLLWADRPEVFIKLLELYPHAVDYCSQLLIGTNQSLRRLTTPPAAPAS
jgi:hypothetical protein